VVGEQVQPEQGQGRRRGDEDAEQDALDRVEAMPVARPSRNDTLRAARAIVSKPKTARVMRV